MKVHEIKDGVALQMSGAILNEHTKLVDSFWEHCKPLLEKGPKNTIDFVHYSAKEWVLLQLHTDNLLISLGYEGMFFTRQVVLF